MINIIITTIRVIAVTNIKHLSNQFLNSWLLSLLYVVTTLDQVAEKTLAKCEENFPIITKPPSEVCSSKLKVNNTGIVLSP